MLRLLFVLIFFHACAVVFAQSFTVTSPDKNIVLRAWTNPKGEILYSVTYYNKMVLKESRLGLVLNDADLSTNMKYTGTSAISLVKDQYSLFTGKKSKVSYLANKRTLSLRSKEGLQLNIVFQLSNDGVAFRYQLPYLEKTNQTITEEITSFHFDTAAKAFLQPMQEAKTGWEKTNPAYEEHYQQNIAVTRPAPTKGGWVYPALFEYKNIWMLITEAGLDSNDCATRLQQHSPNGEYRIGFPDKREIMPGGGLLPKLNFSFATDRYTPWRIITIGSLKTIVESTLGTDLAKSSIQINKDFIKPGKSSWSWIMSKDDSIVYTEQIRYIDFANKMNWQYCLVDADWDRKIGYEKIKELSAYAASKNVGLLLWYNSAGSWNTVRYTPKDILLTHESRMDEFKRLKQIGIKGVKIDFFGGDGQSVIQYYIDILNDAAKHELLVNFHGATLPRGWHRTYPHLLTTEAVRGFEMVTFNQKDADAQANHCAMLPFTRNAFDPMDFTPMNLNRIPTRVKRKTTGAFELATSVLFLSGIQHFAESPGGMNQMPGYVQEFLKSLPVQWDDVKFIDGFPGKYVVLARRSGTKWYLAGINAENFAKEVEVDLRPFKMQTANIITEDKATDSWFHSNLPATSTTRVVMKPSGGFVMVLE